MESEEKIISLRIFMPEDLRNEFKAVCARQGRNMSEVVTEFVKGYVTEHGILPSAVKSSFTEASKKKRTSTEEALFRASRFVDEPDRDNLVPSEDLPAETKKPTSAKTKQTRGSRRSS